MRVFGNQGSGRAALGPQHTCYGWIAWHAFGITNTQNRVCMILCPTCWTLSFYLVELFRLMVWYLPGLIVAFYVIFYGCFWNVCNFLGGDRTGCKCVRQKYGGERRLRGYFDCDVLYEKTIKNLKKHCNMIGRVSSLANYKLWVYWYWMSDEKSIITFEKVLRGSFTVSLLRYDTPFFI